MKYIPSRPQAFHSLKANFTHEVHFTDPARDLFRCVVSQGHYAHPLVGGVHRFESRLTDSHDLARFCSVEADPARFEEYEDVLHKRLEEVGLYLAEL